MTLELKIITVVDRDVTNGKVDTAILRAVEAKVGGIPEKGLTLLQNSVDEARVVWDKAMSSMVCTESEVGAVLTLNERPKLYALDSIAVCKALGVGEEQRMKASQLFSLYYLAVHLFDDAVEDREKLISKFTNGGSVITQEQATPIAVTFALNLNLSLERILKDEDPKRVLEFLCKTSRSLGRQFKYFMAEKDNDMPVNDVLEVKQHRVSGESTAFIMDCLKAVGVDFGDREENIRQALFRMGSLTQFMDDLRDLDEDKVNSNLNLLVALEREKEPAGVVDSFAGLYREEEREMVESLGAAGIYDTDVFRAIPFHPFYMKHLADNEG